MTLPNDLRLVPQQPSRTLLVALLVIGLAGPTGFAQAEDIGSVNTAFHLVKSDRIAVEAFDDPMVHGVTCYVSRARTGGLSGAVGFAEDKNEASIACRQVGAISFGGPLPHQDDIFSQSQSVLFKRLHVVRMVDAKRQTLVYLSYSDRLIDGSPKNSITAVPVGPQSIPLR
jgi:CreA protein